MQTKVFRCLMNSLIYKMRVNVTCMILYYNIFQILLSKGMTLKLMDNIKNFIKCVKKISCRINRIEIFILFYWKLCIIEMPLKVLQAVNGGFLITDIRNHDTCYYSTSNLGPSVSRDVTLWSCGPLITRTVSFPTRPHPSKSIDCESTNSHSL